MAGPPEERPPWIADGVRDEDCHVMESEGVRHDHQLRDRRSSHPGSRNGKSHPCSTRSNSPVKCCRCDRGQDLSLKQHGHPSSSRMVSIREGTRQTREQFPVVAGCALTVNKAQGLALKEGVVINLTSGVGRRCGRGVGGGWGRAEHPN